MQLVAVLIKTDCTYGIVFNGPMVLAWQIRQTTPKSIVIYFASMGPLLRIAQSGPQELSLCEAFSE